MRYVMKQKLFCFGDDFKIKNEAGEDVFFVDGRAFSIGNKLSFQDLNGNELAFIRQKLLSWGPTYEITRGSGLRSTGLRFNAHGAMSLPEEGCTSRQVPYLAVAEWKFTRLRPPL